MKNDETGRFFLNRVFSRCVRDESTGCLNWTGSVNGEAGYGRINVNGALMGTHRLVYQVAIGELIGEELVRHICDNRRCCEPTHLVKGSAKDNAEDARLRGRLANNGGVVKVPMGDIESVRSGTLAAVDCANMRGVSVKYLKQLVAGSQRRKAL
jgi:HNH endonuclease